jgi:diaminopimelate decarboxylase
MAISRPHLRTTRGTLKIGSIPAAVLADEYGTPLYVTDIDRVNQNYDAAESSLKSRYPNSLLAFAYKSNPTEAVVESLSRRGAGATVVSQAGIQLALAKGVESRKIVFDGPSKSEEELRVAIRARVGMINAESTQEVLDVDALCSETGIDVCRVGFRVNLGIKADTHAGLATGSSEHKFGVSRDDVLRFCEGEGRRLEHAAVVGLHSHIGSQIDDTSLFREQTRELVRFAEKLHGICGLEIEEYNLGGGLGVDYGNKGTAPRFEEYAEATAGEFASIMKRDPKEARLVFELGRSIVADSTVLLTRVNYVKRIGNTNWTLVDAGMNDFLRPALYGAYHEIVPAHVKRRGRSNVVYNIAGPVCESTDVLGTARHLGVCLSQGDIIAILDTGAYGISMASYYNMRPLPATVIVSKGKHRLASPRRY